MSRKWQADIARWSVPITGSLPGCPDNLRQGLIVCFSDGQRCFYGDCAPLPGFSTESLAEAERAIIGCCRRLLSRYFPPSDPLDFDTDGGFLQVPSSVLFAIESGLFAIERAANEQPSSAVHDEVTRVKRLPVCRLLSGSNNHIERQLSETTLSAQVVKVKVGRQSVAADIALVKKIENLLPAKTTIRLDANRCWTLDQARLFAQTIDRCRIAFIEEPLQNTQLLPEFARQTGMPVALDESLQWRFPEGRNDPDIFPGLAALVIKPTLAGGIGRCRALTKLARRHGLQVVLSSAYESSLGINTLTRLAMELSPDVAPGLDTLSVFQQSVVEPPLLSAVTTSATHFILPWAQLERVWSSYD